MKHYIATEVRRLIILSWPILLAQIAQTSMGFVDTLVAGRAGTVDLAAVALGAAFWVPVIIFGQGVLTAILPMVARFYGQHPSQDDRETMSLYFRQSVWTALLLSLPLMAVIRLLTVIIPHLGYDETMARMACEYMLYCSWGLPGYMIFCGLRCCTDAMGRVRMAMITAFFGLGMNIVGNLAFVLGYWGFPAYGGVGAGIATALVCWIEAAVMLGQAACMRDIRRWLYRTRWSGPLWSMQREVVRIGLPGALALLCEVALFSAMAALIAPLGATPLASNQVAVSFSGMLFMVPLSLSMATTIRVGMRIGENAPEAARTAARSGMALGLGLAFIMAIAIIMLRGLIPELFTQDREVIAGASVLFFFVACYQIPDALQVIAIGALRAYNDTRAIFLICLVTYWGFGVPAGYLLGRTDRIVPAMGPSGFWIATASGLGIASILLLARLRGQEARFRRLSGASGGHVPEDKNVTVQ